MSKLWLLFIKGMVHETGDATERFLRSVAFGEIDARQLADDRATQALAKMNATAASPAKSPCRGKQMSVDLLAKARNAADLLHSCLDSLEDAVDSRQMRQVSWFGIQWAGQATYGLAGVMRFMHVRPWVLSGSFRWPHVNCCSHSQACCCLSGRTWGLMAKALPVLRRLAKKQRMPTKP